MIDLSALNRFVINEHFQMENISCLKQILNQNDLKDAYLTVGVHEQSQHYLRFIWQGQAYQFQALPFGLCTAPRVFTKLLKPIITFLRTRNIRLLIYLDDILIVGSDLKTLKEQTGQVFRSFAKPGFHNKLRKICTDSFSCHGISRTSSRLQNYDVLSTVTQGDKKKKLLRLYFKTELPRCASWPSYWGFSNRYGHLQYCLIQQLAVNKGSYDGLVSL